MARISESFHTCHSRRSSFRHLCLIVIHNIPFAILSLKIFSQVCRRYNQCHSTSYEAHAYVPSVTVKTTLGEARGTETHAYKLQSVRANVHNQKIYFIST